MKVFFLSNPSLPFSHNFEFCESYSDFYKSTLTFLCQTCGKSFGSKAKLHVYNQIHSEKILIYKICDKILIGIKSFNNHNKIHQTYEHYCDYFQWTGNTMNYTNGKFTETAHLTFKMLERIHKFKITRKIGTPVHKELALKSLAKFWPGLV